MTEQDTVALVGATIGNYTVMKQLGAGAMGEVYLGEHPKIGRKVAIKVLVANLSANPEMAQRFISEARAVNKINHPNIIQIFDFGQLPDKRAYFTMEFLEGRELSHLLEASAPLSLHDTEEILRQIAAALDAAHAVSIVHRDLKPDNIFVIENPTARIVKVLDFGIAKLLEPDLASQHKTSTGMIMGTPAYMSPEQAAGDVGNISPRSDIYSLGLILYQMLSGQLALEAPTTAQLLAKHITEMPKPLAEVTQGLPPAMSDVVARALSKDPNLRQQTAGQLFLEFRAACMQAGPDAVATPVGATRLGYAAPSAGAAGSAAHAPTTLGSSASQVMPTGITGERAKPRMRLAAMVTVIIVLVVAVAAGVFIATRPKKEKTKPAEDVAAKQAKPREEAAQPPMAAAPPPHTVLRLFKVHVKSKTKKVRVEVKIAGQAKFLKRPPFRVSVKEGERVTFRATRDGFEEQVETFVATADRKVSFTLQRAPRIRRSRRRTRVRKTTTRTAGARARTRTRTRTRARGRGKSRVGEGTLKPTF